MNRRKFFGLLFGATVTVAAAPLVIAEQQKPSVEPECDAWDDEDVWDDEEYPTTLRLSTNEVNNAVSIYYDRTSLAVLKEQLRFYRS